MQAYRLHLGEEALVYRLAYNGEVVHPNWARRRIRRGTFRRVRNVWHGTSTVPCNESTLTRNSYTAKAPTN